MNCYEIQEAFGIENLNQTERPDPTAGPGQVLVKVKAVSINFRDILMVRGHYNPRQPLPLIPFSDGAGEIVAVGEGVTRFEVGDRVANCFFQGWADGTPTPETVSGTSMGSPLDGMLTELVALDEAGVVKLPDHLSFEEGATLPCAAVTAWSCLFRHGNVKPGDTVLALGTGGVSIFTLQLAKMAGANVIITSSSDEKLARAKELGADHGVNYKSDEKWAKAVRGLTGGARRGPCCRGRGCGYAGQFAEVDAYGGSRKFSRNIVRRPGAVEPDVDTDERYSGAGGFCWTTQVFRRPERGADDPSDKTGR